MLVDLIERHNSHESIFQGANTETETGKGGIGGRWRNEEYRGDWEKREKTNSILFMNTYMKARPKQERERERERKVQIEKGVRERESGRGVGSEVSN